MNNYNENVSIIMPAFNASDFVRGSIQSVLNQTYCHWKLYIINDCSTDNTKAILAEFKDPRIVFLNTPVNSGVAEARNIGIAKAQGKYIAFLDSDDLWVETKLEKQLDFLENGNDVVCSYYSTFSCSLDKPLSTRLFPLNITYQDMLVSNKVGNLTGIYNQHKLGKFFQKKIGHEDYVMWLEIIKSAGQAKSVPEVLAFYRVSASSLSGNKFKASLWQWDIYRKHLQFGVLKSAYYWLRYIFNALNR